jgi:hypothetical protein
MVCIDLHTPEEVIALKEYLRVEQAIAHKNVKLRFLHVGLPDCGEVERKLVLALASILHAASSLWDLTVPDHCLLSLAHMGHAQLLNPSLRCLSLDFLFLMDPEDPDSYSDKLCWSLNPLWATYARMTRAHHCSGHVHMILCLSRPINFCLWAQIVDSATVQVSHSVSHSACRYRNVYYLFVKKQKTILFAAFKFAVVVHRLLLQK